MTVTTRATSTSSSFDRTALTQMTRRGRGNSLICKKPFGDTGNPCELLVLSEAQWSDAQASDTRVATEIHRDGHPLFPRRSLA